MTGNLTHHFSSNLLCTLLQWDPERSWPSLQQAWKPRRLHLSKQQGWEWHRCGWSIFFLQPSTDSHRQFSSAAAFQCQTRVTSGFQQAHNGLIKTLSKACTPKHCSIPVSFCWLTSQSSQPLKPLEYHHPFQLSADRQYLIPTPHQKLIMQQCIQVHPWKIAGEELTITTQL